MGKISPVASKYIVHASIFIEGIVDKPDVIGAIFGQTEGLLGEELELRELQRSGRIGRIEVNVETRTGKTKGAIIIPSSLDKAETAIVGAALEIIQRIGPCNAKIKVENIEDVRVSKRKFVISRAKELLKNLMETSMPDSQELADEVAYSVRVMEIQEYGKDRLPAGPTIDDADEVIVVEGRADVLNLLKHGIKNAVALNGTNVPQTVIDLSKQKTITVFVDGDRGGDLIIKEMLTVAEVDFITKAPEGTEVEEITKKEIHKALRRRVSPEQYRNEIDPRKDYRPQQSSQLYSRLPQPKTSPPISEAKPTTSPSLTSYSQPRPVVQTVQQRPAPIAVASVAAKRLSIDEKKRLKQMLEDLIGTRGAYVLDEKLNILGKVPTTELITTIKSLSSGVYAIVFDGSIDKKLVETAEKIGVSHLVSMDSKVTQKETRISLVTVNEL